MEMLSANVAGRYTEYHVGGIDPAGGGFVKTGFAASTWKLGLNWQVTDELTLRGTRSRDIHLAQGDATIYAAYTKDFASCPGSAPHHFFAEVHLPGVVVTIGAPICRTCESGTMSYGSLGGMEAVVRGLRRWRPGETE